MSIVPSSYITGIQHHPECCTETLWGEIVTEASFHFANVAWWEDVSCQSRLGDGARRTVDSSDLAPYAPYFRSPDLFLCAIDVDHLLPAVEAVGTEPFSTLVGMRRRRSAAHRQGTHEAAVLSWTCSSCRTLTLGVDRRFPRLNVTCFARMYNLWFCSDGIV